VSVTSWAKSLQPKEQTQGIEQVNKAVVQIDSVTQQNAALVEEATAAACSLQQQTVHLNTAVKKFKIAVVGAKNDVAIRTPGVAPGRANKQSLRLSI